MLSKGVEHLPELSNEISQHAPDADSISTDSVRKYTPTILSVVGFSAEEFMHPAHQRIVIDQITEVVNTEAPISRQLLCKRILSAWGISRLGQRLDSYFESLFHNMPLYKVDHKGSIFIWQSREQLENYSTFRPDSGRDATDLPPEEVANGIRHMLEEQISLPTTDLARLTGQLFGYSRMGTNVETAMHRGIEVAVSSGYIKVENGRAKII